MMSDSAVSICCPLCGWSTVTTTRIPVQVVLALLKHIGKEHCDGLPLPPALESLLYVKQDGKKP